MNPAACKADPNVNWTLEDFCLPPKKEDWKFASLLSNQSSNRKKKKSYFWDIVEYYPLKIACEFKPYI